MASDRAALVSWLRDGFGRTGSFGCDEMNVLDVRDECAHQLVPIYVCVCRHSCTTAGVSISLFYSSPDVNLIKFVMKNADSNRRNMPMM